MNQNGTKTMTDYWKWFCEIQRYAFLKGDDRVDKVPLSTGNHIEVDQVEALVDEMNQEITALRNQLANVVIAEFGKGNMVVATGVYNNQPAVFMRAAKESGGQPDGELFGEDVGVSDRELTPDERVILCQTSYHATMIARALRKSPKLFELDPNQ
jgi:ABC-type Fe3+-hydroxamate transport system substrate-binding protein